MGCWKSLWVCNLILIVSVCTGTVAIHPEAVLHLMNVNVTCDSYNYGTSRSKSEISKFKDWEYKKIIPLAIYYGHHPKMTGAEWCKVKLQVSNQVLAKGERRGHDCIDWQEFHENLKYFGQFCPILDIRKLRKIVRIHIYYKLIICGLRLKLSAVNCKFSLYLQVEIYLKLSL